ncbi:MAG: putative bifunctional diguanylate cyclase/phosphodiesterase [Sphingomonadaceae bacterium]
MVSKGKRIRAEIPANLERWVANRQVSAYFRLVDATIWGQVFNAFVLTIALFIAAPVKLPVIMLAIVQIGLFVIRERSALRRKSGVEKLDPQYVIRQTVYNSTGLAVVYAVGIALFFPYAIAQLQLVIAVAATSMITVASFAFRYILHSALWFVAVMTSGFVIALLQLGTLEGIVCAVVVTAVAVRINMMSSVSNETFIIRVLRERELNNSNETVKMLLNDFQAQGSDWLFELDVNARLLSVSDRFANALGLVPESLNGRLFADLFEPGPERDQLVSHITEKRAFRSLSLRVSKQCADEAWWSISARPVAKSETNAAHFRGVISDISAAKKADARVRYMAHYDSLTDLPNRTLFVSTLNRAFLNPEVKQRLVLILIDIDHFKAVNDIYGHPIGDAFIRHVGERIAACTKDSGLGGEGHIVARLGGDEFAVLMSGEDVRDHSIRLAQALVDDLAAPFVVGDHTINSSASIGLAIAPEHANNAQMLQNNADIALYVAKNAGRNRWELFEAGMDVAVQQRHAIERDLRLALTRDEFRLYFQPLVNVETGLHTGFEALIRWEHPENGMVMPNDFIPIAEESGLIVPMGEWVIRTAMAEAVRWSEPRTIAINLSPVQLRSANLLPTIINALGETGLDPARLEVEITESVLLNDCEANIAILNRLHDLGIKIALDDFGTGYASLNYLRTFPFDKIKIDRTFVTELGYRADCRAIVSAVISLANNLGMCTLAEGVESEEQLAALRSEGCSMVQGWLFGKAMPAEHYASLRTIEVPTLPAPAVVQPPERKVA